MTAANPSRVGQIGAAGDVEALWLKVFSGEVLTAFETVVKLRGKIRERVLTGAKSAQFPATFKAKASYHTPGAEILGQKIKHNEVTIALDDLLISDVFIADIDEVKNHYDVRAPYSTELGNSLALFYDRTLAQVILSAARDTTPLFTGDGAGSSIVEADVSGTADFDASGADMIDAIALAKQAMDERDVPVDTMAVHGMVKPAQWYLMARSDKNVNQDYGGQGSVTRDVLTLVSDVQVIKSNAPLFGKDVTPYDAGTNADGLVGAPDTDAYALPDEYPTKYHGDNTNTRGIVWVEPAAAVLTAKGVQLESAWDIRRQGTLMVAKMLFGAGKLRSKCAVEIKTA
jgi:hypothetical protein